jgi:hypothetical protein
MSNQPPSLVLSKIAFYRNRRDEVPNQELAKELTDTRSMDGITQIAVYLWDKNKNVQSDCLKVLYEIGYLSPDLITPYVGDFLKLLRSKNNRMVWGAMIALGTIADRCAEEIWAQVDLVMNTMNSGTLITVVWGIKVLAKVAASAAERREKIFPFLLQQLKYCLPRDIPSFTDYILCAIDESVKAELLTLLIARQPELTLAQQTRLKKVQKTIENIVST